MTGVINLFWCFVGWFLLLIILGPSFWAADLGVLGYLLAFAIVGFWIYFALAEG